MVRFQFCALLAFALPNASAASLTLFGPPPVRDPEALHDLRRTAKHNVIAIPVQLNGGGAVLFALDSGASSTIVGERLASTLNLKQGKSVTGQGAGTGACILRELPDVRVRAARTDVASSVFAASLEPLETFLGLRMNGVVGGTLFLTHIVSVDYRRRKARISNTANFLPKPNDARILVTRSGLLCCVADAEIEVRGIRRRVRLLIDTGALPFEIVLTREFAAQQIPLDSRTEMLEVPGLCGMSTMARAAGIARIQGLPAVSVAVFISSDYKGLLSSASFDGVIGSELLRRFGTVIFDAPHNEVLFRRD